MWWTLQLSPRGMNPFLLALAVMSSHSQCFGLMMLALKTPFSGPHVAKVTPSSAAGLHAAPLCRSVALISKLRGVLTTDAAQLSIDHP